MLHKTKFLSRVSTQWQMNMGTVIFINWWCNICNISLLWWVMNSWPKKSCRWKKVQGTLHKQALKLPFKNIWDHITLWKNVTWHHNWALAITSTVSYVVTVNTSTIPYYFCHKYPIILPTTYINIALHRQVCMHITQKAGTMTESEPGPRIDLNVN